MEQLQISESKVNQGTLLEISGTVNSYTYTDFQEKVYSLVQKDNLIIDMGKVSNLSSAGLGVLMSAMEEAEEKDFTLYILNPSDIVKASIDSTGFADIFHLLSSLSEIK